MLSYISKSILFTLDNMHAAYWLKRTRESVRQPFRLCLKVPYVNLGMGNSAYDHKKTAYMTCDLCPMNCANMIHPNAAFNNTFLTNLRITTTDFSILYVIHFLGQLKPERWISKEA